MSEANEAARQLRIAADCVEATALSDEMQDMVELIAFHIRDKVTGGMTDRQRQTTLMLRLLDRA